MSDLRRYRIILHGFGDVEIEAATRDKAKYKCFMGLYDAGYHRNLSSHEFHRFLTDRFSSCTLVQKP